MTALSWVSVGGLACVLTGLVVGPAILSRGFAQRLNFATYFGWVIAVSLLLPRSRTS